MNKNIRLVVFMTLGLLYEYRVQLIGQRIPLRLLIRNGSCLNQIMCYSLAFGFTLDL